MRLLIIPPNKRTGVDEPRQRDRHQFISNEQGVTHELIHMQNLISVVGPGVFRRAKNKWIDDLEDQSNL